MKYTPSIYFIEKKERKKNEIPSTAASTKIAKSRNAGSQWIFKNLLALDERGGFRRWWPQRVC